MVSTLTLTDFCNIWHVAICNKQWRLSLYIDGAAAPSSKFGEAKMDVKRNIIYIRKAAVSIARVSVSNGLADESSPPTYIGLHWPKMPASSLNLQRLCAVNLFPCSISIAISHRIGLYLYDTVRYCAVQWQIWSWGNAQVFFFPSFLPSLLFTPFPTPSLFPLPSSPLPFFPLRSRPPKSS